MAAGTSYVNLTLSNGERLSVLISTSAAIGTIPTTNLFGTATTTTPTDFQVRSNAGVVDQVNTVGTAGSVSAGQIELYNVTLARRTGFFFDLETTGHAVTVNNRNFPRIGFRAGFTYRFVVSTAQVSA